MAKRVVAGSGDEFRRITARAADSKAIGRIVARAIESQSQRAFIEQRLGEYEWPERYPSMDDPFVNKAALVNWTNTGGDILERFFDRIPAGLGTGGFGSGLAGSISVRISDGFLEVGSSLPYAGNMQYGLESSQPVTSQAKRTIGRFIGMEERDGGWKKKKRLGPKQKANREKYFFRLAPLLGMDILSTQQVQRPFIGITPENERDIVDSIEEYVSGSASG